MSSSPSKSVRIQYDNTFNNLQLQPLDNIFNIIPDEINKRLLYLRNTEIVDSEIQTWSQTEWSDVASSDSEDSSDEKDPKSSNNDSSKSTQQEKEPQPESSDQASTSSSVREKDNNSNQASKFCKILNNTEIEVLSNDGSGINNLNKLNISKPEVSKMQESKFEFGRTKVYSKPVNSSASLNSRQTRQNKKFIKKDGATENKRGLFKPFLVSNKEYSEVDEEQSCASLSSNNQSNEKSNKSFQRAEKKQRSKNKEYQSRSGSVSALSDVSQKFSNEQTFGRESKFKKKDWKQKKNNDDFKKRSPRTPKISETNLPENSTEESHNLESSPINDKMAPEILNNYRKKKEFNRDGSNYKFTGKKGKMDPKLKKPGFEDRIKSPNQEASLIDWSVQCFSHLTHAMLINRMNEENINEKQEVGLYCKICSLSELNHFNFLSHFNGSDHWSKDKISVASNYYCPVCKLIICCEEGDSAKEIEDHATSVLHTYMEKVLSKLTPSQNKGLRLSSDRIVIKKFKCTLMKFQPSTNNTSFLVPYDSSEENTCEEERSCNEESRNRRPVNYNGAFIAENSLANIWVFPLKRSQKNYPEQNWVKFIGGADTHRLYELLLPMLSNVGDVERCLLDNSSVAVYIQFRKRDSVQNFLKILEESPHAPSLQLVKLENQ